MSSYYHNKCFPFICLRNGGVMCSTLSVVLPGMASYGSHSVGPEALTVLDTWQISRHNHFFFSGPLTSEYQEQHAVGVVTIAKFPPLESISLDAFKEDGIGRT